MEFVIERSELLGGLYLAQGIVERRTTVPILNNVLISAVDRGVTISATDQEVAVRCLCLASVVGKGILTAPARTLYEAIRGLPDGAVHVRHLENYWVEISSGRSRFRLPGLDPAEFPAMPEPSPGAGPPVRIAGAMLNEMIERTLFAVSTDESRANLNGIYVEVAEEGRLRVVATDGHRLAVITRQVETAQLIRGVTIPRKALLELRKVLEGGGDEPVDIAMEERVAHATRGSVEISMRLVAGEFPDYRQVIPQRSERIVTVGVDALLTALRRVSVVTSERNAAVKMQVEAKQMELATTNSELGEAVDQLEVEYEGEPISVAFNGRYLMDVLAVLPAEVQVEIGLGDEVSPAVIRASGDQDYAYVVMPMRL